MVPKKINLLYVIHSLENGGAETLAIRLAEKIDHKKFQVTVCSLSDMGPLREVLEKKKVPYFTLGKRDGKDLRISFRLRAKLKEYAIDVIHTHNQGPLLYTYLATLLSPKYKIVHTEHINMAKELSYSKKHLLYNRLLYRRLDGFVNIAQHLTNEYCIRFDLSRAKVQTIHNSVDYGKSIVLSPNSLREQLGLSNTVPLIGNISALRPQKDHETLIRAMKKVCEKFPAAILVIAGEGELQNKLVTLINGLELNRNVKLLGFRSDVDGLLKEFDIFVLSSLYEGLPLCILEAMAAGKPIVATDADGTNEIVTDGETGILVPVKNPDLFADAIVSILGDLEKAAEMGRAAQNFVETKHNMDKMISQYELFYKELFNG